jgi:hypothetical protein
VGGGVEEVGKGDDVSYEKGMCMHIHVDIDITT